MERQTEMDYPEGLDPYTARQHLLRHKYSPLVSIQASRNSDIMIQSLLDNSDISMLELMKPYGNNAKYSVPNQVYKITNSHLITKNYPSFPVRFEPSLPEMMSIMNASSDSRNANQLFSISSLELLLKHIATTENESNIYLNFFNKVITSNKIVPFETFNHPVAQLFIIEYENDSVDYLRKMMVEFRNYNFPKYFQIEDLLMHVFILYDSSKINVDDVTEVQNEIKAKLNTSSTPLPIIQDSDGSFVDISFNENSTIDEDLQRLSLNSGKTTLQVPQSIDILLRAKLYDFVNKYVIRHMQSKVRDWDDQILQPRRSITNKFFSASKKLFNNESNSSTTFNAQENYYYRTSPEQTIRKLADWSLILKDFKYAYSTYDLIKKDFSNDKAWAYVASTEEMCMVSLLLAQTQQISIVAAPDRNTLRKIRHDIIEPYIDNSSYTFKSRLNLKTYSIKSLLIVIELLLCMSISFNISWWWGDLIETFLCKCIAEFDSHSTQGHQIHAIRATIYERLGYSLGKSFFLSDSSKNFPIDDEHDQESVKEGHFINVHKLKAPSRTALVGLTRFRKSAIWYLLSIKEWLVLDNSNQVKQLLNNVHLAYNIDFNSDEWHDKEGLLLTQTKAWLKEKELENKS